MERNMQKQRERDGFTIIELLVAIAIIIVIAAIILALISNSRAKASDARTQETLGNIRTVATEEKLVSESFAPSFAPEERVGQAVAALAEQQDIEAGEYSALASDNEFVIAFPLKAQEGYWCVDSDGIAKKVNALPTGTPPYNCNNVSGGGSESGDTDHAPVMTAIATGICNTSHTFCFLRSAPNIRIAYPTPGFYTQGSGFMWNGVTVMDEEDGDLTDQVSVSILSAFGNGTAAAEQINSGGYGVTVTSCSNNYFKMTYSVTDSDGNFVSQQRSLYSCSSNETVGGGNGGGLGGGGFIIQ